MLTNKTIPSFTRRNNFTTVVIFNFEIRSAQTVICYNCFVDFYDAFMLAYMRFPTERIYKIGPMSS